VISVEKFFSNVAAVNPEAFATSRPAAMFSVDLRSLSARILHPLIGFIVLVAPDPACEAVG
jgi:hypothetical protein